ncbi:MAG: helix-turn-helix transcriptional regulator [Clostridia bacterium]|nr:helix-turn-helix transcriptional regulator [Clostridia bacterium]
MKRFNNNSNITGELIKNVRTSKGFTKEDVCKKLQLLGINIDRVELYRMETNKMIIKDFELIAFCKVLGIDYDALLETIHE